MQHLIEEIKKNALEYGSIPFWSWNDKLEEAERAQKRLEALKNKDM